MKNQLSMLAVLGLAVGGSAQPIETITYSIEWDSASVLTEATGSVYATITPDLETTTAWNTKPGVGQMATLMRFGASIMDLVNVKNGSLGTLTWTVPADLNVGVPGAPDGNGGIKSSHAGQFMPPTVTMPPAIQKVKILDLKWTLNEPAPMIFQVTYATKSTSAKVWLDAGLASYVGENAVKIDGKGSFQVIPAPASTAFLGLAMLMTRRRRT